MSVANNLLIWMSAKAEGSWSQFRSAVEKIHADEVMNTASGDDSGSSEDATTNEYPLYQRTKDVLEQLAHVEFGKDLCWRTVPPSLAVSKSENKWVGILCGARPPSLCADLQKVSGDVSVTFDNFFEMPDRICLISSDFDALFHVSEKFNLRVQKDAPMALLVAMPSINEHLDQFSCELPSTQGAIIHKFSADNWKWKNFDTQKMREARTGLFRFQIHHQRSYYLRWKNQTYKVPVYAGKYIVLQRRRAQKIVRHDPSGAIFSVPAACRPPLLIERALVLCSGRIPQFNGQTRRLEYNGVSPKIARIASGLLCQQVHSP